MLSRVPQRMEEQIRWRKGPWCFPAPMLSWFLIQSLE